MASTRRGSSSGRVSLTMRAKDVRASASAYVGVSKDKTKWAAKIKHEGKDQHLGTFGDEEDAARAFDAAARWLAAAEEIQLPRQYLEPKGAKTEPSPLALESLDVIDKVPDESVKLASD